MEEKVKLIGKTRNIRKENTGGGKKGYEEFRKGRGRKGEKGRKEEEGRYDRRKGKIEGGEDT